MQGEANFNYNMFRLNLWTRHFLHPSVGPPGMDASSYLAANPLASPALMVLQGAAAEGGRDAHHLAAGHAAHTEKDQHVPALYRPGEPFPAHLYGQLHQSFLRPHLDPALGLLSGHRHGLYRFPVPDERESYPSAFAPTKRARTDGQTERQDAKEKTASPRGTPTGGEDKSLSSPASLHRESPLSEAHSDIIERSSPESSGNIGNLKWPYSDGVRCPVCHAVLQTSEVAGHLAKELLELQLLSQRPRSQGTDDNMEQIVYDESNNSLQGSPTKEGCSKSRYETYMRIKNNREARLSKIRGRRKRFPDDSAEGDSIMGMNENESECQDDETIDVIGCEDTEREDTWLAERRRLSGTNMTKNSEEMKPGVPRDQRLSTSGDSELADDRKAVDSRVKDIARCSVCGEAYTCPVTSMQCWHVHCEKCWLQPLGAKQACPQCNTATTMSDLRRIYI